MLLSIIIVYFMSIASAITPGVEPGSDRGIPLMGKTFTTHSEVVSGPLAPMALSLNTEREDTASVASAPIVSGKNIGTAFKNIKRSMFKTSADEYLILTLNLHTYQENEQEAKFNILTEVIGQMDIDFIAFQECAQHRTSRRINQNIREDNMALVITEKLKEQFNKDYTFVWDWAHYGWDVWEEGVAILSQHPLLASESRYISSDQSRVRISSRNAVFGAYLLPEGRIHIFSVHTHWRTSEMDNQQNNQIRNIHRMVNEKERFNPVIGTFVCGDFNGNPTSQYPWDEGYNTMINNGEYIDTFQEIYPDANERPANNNYNTIEGTFPGRIDYIFMKNTARFIIIDSQIIFTRDDVGVVSDHKGVLTKVRFRR